MQGFRLQRTPSGRWAIRDAALACVTDSYGRVLDNCPPDREYDAIISCPGWHFEVGAFAPVVRPLGSFRMQHASTPAMAFLLGIAARAPLVACRRGPPCCQTHRGAAQGARVALAACQTPACRPTACPPLAAAVHRPATLPPTAACPLRVPPSLSPPRDTTTTAPARARPHTTACPRTPTRRPSPQHLPCQRHVLGPSQRPFPAPRHPLLQPRRGRREALDVVARGRPSEAQREPYDSRAAERVAAAARRLSDGGRPGKAAP